MVAHKVIKLRELKHLPEPTRPFLHPFLQMKLSAQSPIVVIAPDYICLLLGWQAIQVRFSDAGFTSR
jgi:hypothetical protein